MKRKVFCFITVVTLFIGFSANFAFADYYSDYDVLNRGDSGANVADLQSDLSKLGYFNSAPTGYFGGITERSVAEYQKDNNLTVDGIVGHQVAREIKVDEVLQTAKSFIGVPYVWGGVSPSGFDCSGFTHYVLLQNGIVIPRSASQQYNQGTWVSRDNLKPGDFIFFTTYKPGASHVGIYLGNNEFIHASSGAGRITISDLRNTYYAQHYIGAKRIIN